MTGFESQKSPELHGLEVGLPTHPGLNGTFWVLVLKTPHQRKPLDSPGQKEIVAYLLEGHYVSLLFYLTHKEQDTQHLTFAPM